jgi:DNA polymerase V
MLDNQAWLNQLETGDVWGIGRQWQTQLINKGIHTAFDLMNMDTHRIKNLGNVMLAKTVLELQGISCIEWAVNERRHSIVSSRSFGTLQTDYHALREAVSYHCAIAWEKLRRQKLKTKQLCVYIHSNHFRKDLAQYHNAITIELVHSTDDITLITRYAQQCLKKIYKERIHYKKCGVLFSDLYDKNHQQYDLFHQPFEESLMKSDKTMQVMEAINHKYGDRVIHLAAEGMHKTWSMKRAFKTPSYTTKWSDLPISYAR